MEVRHCCGTAPLLDKRNIKEASWAARFGGNRAPGRAGSRPKAHLANTKQHRMADESTRQKRKEVATPDDVVEEKSAKKPFALAGDEVYFDGNVMKLSDFRPIKDAPRFWITRDGHVKGPSGQTVRHFLQFKNVQVFIDTFGFDPKPDPTATSEWRDVRGHQDLQFNPNTGEFRNGVSSKGSLQVAVQCHRHRPTCPVDMAIEESWCRPEERLFAEDIQNLRFQYEDIDLDFECALTVPPTRRRQLLIIKRPDLVPFYSARNEDRKIGLLACQSNTVFYWLHDVCGHEFTMTPEAFAGRVHPCVKCAPHSQTRQLDCDTVADGVEIYFTEKLQAAAGVEFAIRTGQLYNGKEDGIVKLARETGTHPVQYKSMYHKKAEQYSIDCKTANYPANMLLAATNQNRDRFWVGLFSDVVSAKRKLSVTFTPRSKAHLANKFTNEAAAIKAIIDLLPKSLDMADFKDEDRYGKTQLLEKKMREAFKAKAESRGLHCRDHDKIHSPIDLFCNGFAVQAKYTSRSDDGRFLVATNTRYTLDDKIDVFVVQIESHVEQFIIIPIAVMVELGYIATPTQAGTFGFHVPSPGRQPKQADTKVDQLQQYWNAWHVLGEPVSMM